MNSINYLTSRDYEVLFEYLSTTEHPDYAKSSLVAQQTVVHALQTCAKAVPDALLLFKAG